MPIADSSGAPTRLEGKYTAMVVCWILGLGSLVAWNSMLTIGDYYHKLFPKFHPSRVLTLVYQPFALGTMTILAYNEPKINTRCIILTAYILFLTSTSALIVLDLASSGKGGIGNYIGICIIVAAFGVADAHVQGGMVGDLSFMCPEFIQSFLAGLAASGALTSALRLMTKGAFEKSNNGLRKGVTYNVWDFISRYIPLLKSLKLESRKGLMIATLSRFLLIPAFYFTAKYGGQGWMIALTSFLGLTNGYLTVCIFTASPKGYKGSDQNTLGNLLVLCLLAGIFSGVALDWLWLIGSNKKF